MPNIKHIKETMRKLKISPVIISQIDSDTDDNDPMKIVPFFDKMDKLLTNEQRLAVMERQGCHKSGKYEQKYKTFGEENKGKTLTEKLEQAKITSFDGDIPYIDGKGDLILEVRCYHNDDNDRITAKNCHCVHKSISSSVSSTFCGCCAGHKKHHWQNGLGIELRLKSIGITSETADSGYKRVFTYEIVG